MSRDGAALVEVLIALVILSSAAVMTVIHLTEIVADRGRVESREAESAEAERLLIATRLLTRAELEQRLGARPVGGYVVWVDRPETALFRIGIARGDVPDVELISTLVYRAREGDDGA